MEQEAANISKETLKWVELIQQLDAFTLSVCEHAEKSLSMDISSPELEEFHQGITEIESSILNMVAKSIRNDITKGYALTGI